jgi:UDP-2,3-diacylglucosamine pyrophosphatase LpxH
MDTDEVDNEIVRLVISDLHLGAAYAKEELLCKLLANVECDELILAGDIIDFIKVPKFTEKTALLFELLNSLTCRKIYVIGNHDYAFKKFTGKTVSGIEFMDKYEFTYSGRKYRIEHGDKYQTGIIHWRIFMTLFSIFQDWVERNFSFNLAAFYVRWKKRKLKRIWDIVQWNNDVDVFIMGHTHKPEALIWVDQDENIKTYVNTGDWVDHQTYVLIKNGNLRLKNYECAADNYSSEE